MTRPMLQCGIMCNGTSFKAWQVKAIRELIASGVAEIKLLIIDDRLVNRKPVSISNKILKKNSLFNFYYNRIIKSAALEEIDLPVELTHIKKIYCSPTTNKTSEVFSSKDVDEIKNLNLDFIIRFGFNIIKGEILKTARYGVWSYHHGDEMKYRGGPPAFWEIYNNDPVTGTVLQKLTDKLDAGIILKKGYYKTVNHSYKETLNTILFESAGWITEVCKDITSRNGEDPQWKGSGTKAKVCTFPVNRIIISFLIKSIFNKIKFHFQDLFLVEQWNFGIIKQPLSQLLSHEIKNEITFFPYINKKHFAADAFGFMKDKKLEILYENFNYKKGKADIFSTSFDPTKNLFTQPKSVITSTFHLAYPYIIKDKNEVYCLPENNDGENYIYKLKQDYEVWERELIDLPENDLIDCSVFYYDNLYWLFCTRKSEGSNLKLFIYYSTSLKGSYQPHLLNPVKTDITSSRPAGTPFIFNNDIYRPSQDSSFTYGGRIKINKITSLSPSSFSEEPYKVIEPFNKTYNKGIHTFAVVDDFVLIDSKRFIFSFSYFVNNMRRKLNIK